VPYNCYCFFLILNIPCSRVINGGCGKAKILPYKHAIEPYGVAMGGIPSQIAYGGWQKSAVAEP